MVTLHLNGLKNETDESVQHLMLPLILIGGSARMGKTTLSKRLISKYSLFGLSMDCITAAMRNDNVLSKYFPSPLNSSWDNPEKFIENMRIRDELAWEFTMNYIMNSGRKGNSLLVEGMIWPDMVDKYLLKDCCGFSNIEILFIVDTSNEEIAFKSIKSMRLDSYDWINKYNDNKIKEFVVANKRRSEIIKEMCNEYDYKVYDLCNYKDKNECQEYIISNIEKTFSSMLF